MKNDEMQLLRDHPCGVSWEDPTVKSVKYSRFGRDWLRFAAQTDPWTSYYGNNRPSRRVEEASLLAKDGTRLGRIVGTDHKESIMHLMLRLRKVAKYLDVHYAVIVVKDYTSPQSEDDDPKGEVRTEVTIVEALEKTEPWKICEIEIEFIKSIKDEFEL